MADRMDERLKKIAYKAFESAWASSQNMTPLKAAFAACEAVLREEPLRKAAQDVVNLRHGICNEPVTVEKLGKAIDALKAALSSPLHQNAEPIPFEDWWTSQGKFIDPDTEDVPWYDKREGLAGAAYLAGQQSVKFAQFYPASPLHQEAGLACNCWCKGDKYKAPEQHAETCPWRMNCPYASKSAPCGVVEREDVKAWQRRAKRAEGVVEILRVFYADKVKQAEELADLAMKEGI